MVQGRCLCGDVRWEVRGPFAQMTHCHCSMCRKSHGAPFATYAAAPAEGFGWVQGEDRIVRYESSPGFDRPFCGRCGSVVAGDPHTDGTIFMPVGNLENDPGARPEAHIFAASKAPWFEIEDALRCFDVYPPGVGGEIQREVVGAPQPGRARGSCLCGRIAYEIETGPHPIVLCHCSRCRRGRSAAHCSNLFLASEKFDWVRGEDEIEVYKVPEAERFTNRFCRTCGSISPRRDTQVGRSMVPAGGLDDDPEARPTMHIFAADKAPWYDIPGALSQYTAGPRAEGTR